MIEITSSVIEITSSGCTSLPGAWPSDIFLGVTQNVVPRRVIVRCYSSQNSFLAGAALGCGQVEDDVVDVMRSDSPVAARGSTEFAVDEEVLQHLVVGVLLLERTLFGENEGVCRWSMNTLCSSWDWRP